MRTPSEARLTPESQHSRLPGWLRRVGIALGGVGIAGAVLIVATAPTSPRAIGDLDLTEAPAPTDLEDLDLAPAPTDVPAVSVDAVTVPAIEEVATLQPLKWVPPSGWEDFERVEIPADGGRIVLEPGVDYRIEADEPVTGPIQIVGGRHVVWMGGEIAIDRPPDGSPTPAQIGLLVRDDPDPTGAGAVARTVHLEGLLFTGSALHEGIDIDAPTAVVQIQNVHIDTVTFPSADARDGTGPYTDLGKNHPDLVQTYGGHLELRIDGLSGRSGCQGLFFKVDHEDGRGGAVRLSRIDVAAVEFIGDDGYSYAGNRMYFWHVETIGDQFIERGTVWIAHHPNAGKVAATPNEREGASGWWRDAYRDGDEIVADTPPGTAQPTDAFERFSPGEAVLQPRVGSDEFGRYVWWPTEDSSDAPGVLDADGNGPGRLYTGSPPGGSYVPRDLVGLGYRSPGYRDQDTTP